MVFRMRFGMKCKKMQPAQAGVVKAVRLTGRYDNGGSSSHTARILTDKDNSFTFQEHENFFAVMVMRGNMAPWIIGFFQHQRTACAAFRAGQNFHGTISQYFAQHFHLRNSIHHTSPDESTTGIYHSYRLRKLFAVLGAGSRTAAWHIERATIIFG